MKFTALALSAIISSSATLPAFSKEASLFANTRVSPSGADKRKLSDGGSKKGGLDLGDGPIAILADIAFGGNPDCEALLPLYLRDSAAEALDKEPTKFDLDKDCGAVFAKSEPYNDGAPFPFTALPLTDDFLEKYDLEDSRRKLTPAGSDFDAYAPACTCKAIYDDHCIEPLLRFIASTVIPFNFGIPDYLCPEALFEQPDSYVPDECKAPGFYLWNALSGLLGGGPGLWDYEKCSAFVPIPPSPAPTSAPSTSTSPTLTPAP